MKLNTRLYLAEPSLLDTISIIDISSANRYRSTVFNWVQKADSQPTKGTGLDQVAIDETVLQLNDE